MLTCYSPFRHWTPKGPVRLACLIHAASVHSEPGSNSPSLKSPNGGESRHPVDSIINQLKDFIGEEPHASHGEPFHQKNHVRSYCAARFPKSRRSDPPFSSRPLLYTAIRLLQVIMTYFPIIFFRERIYRTPPHGDDRLS